MKHLSVDIETYSDIDIGKSGLFRYCESPVFEILLFAYSADFGPVEVIDLTQNETIPAQIIAALNDPCVVKHAYNASFEITCLNKAGLKTSAAQWRCTMLHGLYLGYPAGLALLGKALGLPEEKRKLATGKALIRYFCMPCKPTKRNGNRTRNLPQHDPEKWETFKSYNAQDVVTEMEDYKRLELYPVPDWVQEDWVIDYEMNRRGIQLDMALVRGALAIDAEHKEQLLTRAVELTGMANPNSRNQLLDWLNNNTELQLEKLTKETVAESLLRVDGAAEEVLTIRKALAKSSVSKYTKMDQAVCADGRVRGVLQFYGANRTGRWSGRLVQVQNLPHDIPPAMDTAIKITKRGDLHGLELLYGNVSDTLSQLIRAAFIAGNDAMLCVSDFSAIEARVLSWLAGEEWRMEVFAKGGDIYCMSASSMFGVPVEKHGINGHLRQKGKVAELACVAQGQLVLTNIGLVPIENITMSMKVYDGNNFVSHSGIIYRGEKEVISYDGLTATKDHLVWVEGKARPIPFGLAASSGSYLQKYGSSRKGIWKRSSNQRRAALYKKLERGVCINRMPILPQKRMDKARKFDARQVKRLPSVFATTKNTEMGRPKVYCGKTALYKSKRWKLSKLRSPRNKVQIYFSTGCRTVDDRTLWITRPFNGNRPDRRQWSLRTRKFTLGYTSAKLRKSKTVSKVYDILNCGPYHRFVVSGCLVHNCGYQGGPAALISMGALKQGLTEEELPDIVQRWRSANPRIRDFWYAVDAAVISVMQDARPVGLPHGILIARECDLENGYDYLTIALPSGRKLFYPGPYLRANQFDRPALHYRTQTGINWAHTSAYGGKLVENITQAIARDCLALAINRLVKAGYRPIMHIHDEVVLEVPKAALHEDEIDRINAIMCAPIPWAPGLLLNADGFISPYYKKD